MKDYKRLTEKPVNGDKGYIFNCDNCPRKGASFCGTYDCVDMVCDRLGKLEDKIEQGLILELPCKVGDTVWEVNIACTKGVYPIENISLLDIAHLIENKLVGETVFLTKAEAEAKMQELRGGK